MTTTAATRATGTSNSAPSIRARPLPLRRPFAATVAVYLTRVLPLVRRELARSGAHAAAIPAAELREAALEALAKRGNVDGAALFATLAPPRHRLHLTRALAAFQTTYNYLDALSEQPSPRPSRNAASLHSALPAALGGDVGESSFYSLHAGDHDDAGFLTDLIARCRDCSTRLPSFAALAPMAIDAAARIVDFQSLNMPETAGGQRDLERWAATRIAPGADLCWWELAGAYGSSLPVYALLAAAAEPGLTRFQRGEVEACYFPWGGALHSLLDSLVDRVEDDRGGRRSLLEHYGGVEVAARRMALLARRALAACDTAPQGPRHRVILTAMCSYYLSAPECRDAHGRAVRDALLEVLGAPLALALSLFAGKRTLHRLTSGAYR